jgi:hypothetical protein
MAVHHLDHALLRPALRERNEQTLVRVALAHRAHQRAQTLAQPLYHLIQLPLPLIFNSPVVTLVTLGLRESGLRKSGLLTLMASESGLLTLVAFLESGLLTLMAFLPSGLL